MSGAAITADDFLTISPRLRVMPIIHGSGDFAIKVRDELLNRPYDCLAVPLPPSFQDDVEAAIEQLPAISVVVQVDAESSDSETERPLGFSYVPIDPCQGVIAALRTVRGERIAREFIDLETPHFEPVTGTFPDPYALKRVTPERFAAALLPAVPRPRPGQHTDRIAWMAGRLRELEARYQSIFFVCSIIDWPWIRDAYQRRLPRPEPETFFSPMATYAVDPKTLIFALGELPYITGLYERGRRELTADDNLSVDGVKELVLDARERLQQKEPRIAQRLTPQLLSVYFRYVRNLSLFDKRLTPDLYTLVIAAQQTAGDEFALALAETARTYQFDSRGVKVSGAASFEENGLARMAIDQAELPVWGAGPMVSRLPGQALTWRTCELRPAHSRTTRRAGSSAGTPLACARGLPRTSESRAFTATSATRRGPFWALISRELKSLPRACATVSIFARPFGTGIPAGFMSESCRRAAARSRSSFSFSTSPPIRPFMSIERPGTPSTLRSRRWPFTPRIR